MKPVILFRERHEVKDMLLNRPTESSIAKKYFEVKNSRVGIVDSLVIGRYSVLPFYHELEQDLNLQGSRLINSRFEHQYVANFDYYEDVKDLTAKTWFTLAEIPKTGPYFLKGRTNSRKEQWNKSFAKDYQEAVSLYCELENDPLINEQGTIIREYLPLKILDHGLNGTPFANEWRFFFYRDNLLAHGFYWVQSEVIGEMDSAGLDFSKKVAERLSSNVNFFVVDIAQKLDGSWVLIEVNDGCMSGLSSIDPDQLYSNLRKFIDSDRS